MMKSQIFQRFFTAQRNFFKIFLIGILSLNILAVMTGELCLQVLHIPTLYDFFGLSKLAIENAWYWQIFTSAFLLPAQSFSLGWIFSMIISMYLTSAIGSAIVSRKGLKHFFILYFGTALFVSLCMLATFYSSSTAFSPIYFGNRAMLGCILFAWCILYPEMRVQLFFIIPIKLTSLLFWTFLLHLIFALTQQAYSELIAYVATLVYTYFYCLFSWRQKTPFAKLHGFEEKTLLFLGKFSKTFEKGAPLTNSKIYDFKTGKAIISDEAFFHAAMAKITLKGKKSLTVRERLRLWKISRKMQKQNSI
ncbi:MAG: hypothetical protein HKM07_06995 [Chlamydiae bacterium]|nr:hypothetical protein [Chlamydiota bacterium]